MKMVEVKLESNNGSTSTKDNDDMSHASCDLQDIVDDDEWSQSDINDLEALEVSCFIKFMFMSIDW